MQKYEFLRLPAADVWGVLLPKDAPLAASARIRPEDLRDAPLIVSRQMLVGRELSQWLQRDLKTMHVAVTYNLLYNAAIMVEEGLGYALCLDKLARLGDDSRLCFRPLEPKLEAGLNVVWKKYQIFPKAAELFLRKLQETFASAAV